MWLEYCVFALFVSAVAGSEAQPQLSKGYIYTAGEIGIGALGYEEGLKKEDDSFMDRLIQETDMSVAPTVAPPTGEPPTAMPSMPRPPTPELTKGLCFQTNEELRAGVDQFFSGNETTVEILYGQIEDWCFSSNVTNMSNLFESRRSFNSDISSWNVQYVTNMQAMFRGASTFNQSLARWNVSNVIDMSLMFYCDPQADCIFNQPLDAWDVSKVTNMNGMFAFNPVFNQPLDSWDVSSVTDMGSTFAYAYALNQPLGSWNVSSVTDMGGMFSFESRTERRGAFNQDLCAWGPLLQGRSVVFQEQGYGRNMFTLTSCPSEENPNLEASPPGPFCHICE